MFFQFLLYVIYGLGVLAVLRRLNVPSVWLRLGSVFFLGITFLDRPDTLAFAFGTWSLYAWLRSSRVPHAFAGNAWAWCVVVVVCRWHDFEGTAVLGGCSYESEDAFRRPGGYFEDLQAEALADLNRNVNGPRQQSRPRGAQHDH